ncbi:MAG: family 10 glycosylhydrolase [Verrucomicrobiae bacterium]
MKKLYLLLISSALVLASPVRAEFRAAWIASVYNINFPSKPGLSAETQRAQGIQILDAAKSAGLNAVLLQVRPESDALYPSQIEPWSRYLTGTQGRSPGYDPLAFFIAEARKRGISVHAWLNPYRAAADAKQPRSENHISNKFPQFAYRIGSVLWMDPGAPQVQRQIVAVVRDLVSRYDLAGIHLDDYFYPYPPSGGGAYPFPDEKTYAAYRAGGGSLGRADWRRNNAHLLIRAIGEVVRATKPGVIFGVSPFGIYTKGSPPDVRAGVDQYHELYSDPLKWMSEGWIDYLAPQLYWAEGGPQSFSSLLRWWRSPQANPRGVPIWPGLAVDRLSSHGWPASEIATQLELEKSIAPRGRGGFLLWNIGPLTKNTKNILPVIRSH